MAARPSLSRVEAMSATAMHLSEVMTLCTSGSTGCQGVKLGTATGLIALDIHNDRIGLFLHCFRLAFSWCGFQAAYTMQHAYSYDWDPLKGWKAAEEKDFIPYSLSFSYASPSKKFRYWKNRITWAPSLQTSFVYDLARPAESYFTFIPAMTFRINQFLYLTFSSESRNSVVFRYFEGLTGYEDIISGEKNPFKDLADSFAFWDMDRRKASGFKVKNFKMTLAHNLHDWTFASSYVFKPRIIKDEQNKSVFSYDPYFSFIISWRPMSGLRTQVTDEYGEVQLNP